MKKLINWKLFSVLLVASVIVTPGVLPYEIALSPALTEIPSPTLLAASIIQGAVLFSIFIFIGLLLAKRVGFTSPILEGVLRRESQAGRLKSILGLSVGLGILGGVLVILLSFLFPQSSIAFLKAEMSVATWKGFLASFYGGIGEEIFARLFLMTIFAWIISRIIRKPDGRPANAGIWIAIILSSILFGLGHLPISGEVTAITSTVVFRAVLLNGVVGVIFGWLYWKKGLEAAIIAHFSADIVLHVATPLLASLFL